MAAAVTAAVEAATGGAAIKAQPAATPAAASEPTARVEAPATGGPLELKAAAAAAVAAAVAAAAEEGAAKAQMPSWAAQMFEAAVAHGASPEKLALLKQQLMAFN